MYHIINVFVTVLKASYSNIFDSDRILKGCMIKHHLGSFAQDSIYIHQYPFFPVRVHQLHRVVRAIHIRVISD